MSSTADFVFQFAEAASAISLPIGGGLAAYAKWRRSAEKARRAREEAARIAGERAARDAREEERSARDALIKEKDERIRILNEEIKEVREENEKLHNHIVQLLSVQQGVKVE